MNWLPQLDYLSAQAQRLPIHLTNGVLPYKSMPPDHPLRVIRLGLRRT